MILYIFVREKNEESIQVDMGMFSHLQKFMKMFHNSFVIKFTYIINMNIVVCCSIFFGLDKGWVPTTFHIQLECLKGIHLV